MRECARRVEKAKKRKKEKLKCVERATVYEIMFDDAVSLRFI